MEPEVLIFGAGPAGMMAASEFLNNKIRFLVIEKECVVGGLAKTLKYNNFLLDIGPHILSANPNERMYEFTRSLLGDCLINYREIGKNYFDTVRMDDKTFTYPVNIISILNNFTIVHSSRIAYDYIKAKCLLSGNHYMNSSFEKVITRRLGRSLAETFILPYSEKVWGLECSNLSSDLALRVGDTSIAAILKNQIYCILRERNSQSYHPRCYPKEGIGLICERIKENIQNSDIGEIHFNSYPVKLKHDGYSIYEVIVRDNNSQISYTPEYILSSIPIPKLIGLLSPKPPSHILDSTLKLKFRSHICLFLIINKQNVMRENCVYFPDPLVPFGRISEPKNFSSTLTPSNMTSLSIEFFCQENDTFWNKRDMDILEITIIKLEQFGLITRDEIVDYFIHREKYAYPIYDLTYIENLTNIKNYLAKLTNIKIAGRSGAFNYMGQYRSMEMGSNKAKEISSKIRS